MNWLARLLGRDTSEPATPPRAASTAALSASACAPADAVALHVRDGNALLAAGRLSAAADAYRRAIDADAAYAGAHVNLGYVLIELGQQEEALAPLRRAVELAPQSNDAHYLLATALISRHAFASAAAHLERAIALDRGMLVAYRDLGKLLHDIGQLERAQATLRSGLAVGPANVDLHHYLGNVELQQMKLDEALASYRRVLALQPGHAVVLGNVAQVLLNLGDFQGATEAARQAVALAPSMHIARSNLLMALSCDPRCSPEAYLAEARQYGEWLVEQVAPRIHPAPRVAVQSNTARQLNIGFVSGDLHNHPVGFFLESVLAHWDMSSMKIIAYSNHPAHDDLTTRLRSRFTAWRDISSIDDAAAARLVERDGIDVLVDLSGYTAFNRLPLFAHGPAPLQVAWLGYWASTGLPTIDHVLADPVSVPPQHRHHFSESICYLPDTRLCFSPPVGPDVPAPAGLPALTAGHLTFGSFQRLTKLNDSVLALWARVLRAVPGSHLRLQSAQMKDPSAREHLLTRLANAGIALDKVHLVEAGTRIEYLAAHADVDLILDTFPHSGATTTCEALWMGVPTLTLAGQTMLARQGASLLGCAGLSDWVAADVEDYVERAVRHASGVDALARLRSGLRDQVAGSPLFDAALFARHLQGSLRNAWDRRTAHSLRNP